MKKQFAEHSVRIIGGEWRGRRIPVLDQDGLRPTKDFVRETLFNWLQPVVEGSRCLDVFAGSGALGFEAASRGAASVTMLEKEQHACRQLEVNKEKLHAGNVDVRQTNAEVFLANTGKVYDIVFLDPPYQSLLLPQVCALLCENAWLRIGSYVYIEFAGSDSFVLPVQWEWHRRKKSGDVNYGLAKVVA